VSIFFLTYCDSMMLKFFLYVLLSRSMEMSASSCPPPCQCSWKDSKFTLNCAEKKITKVPVVSNSDISAVILDRNTFHNLQSFQFATSGLAQARKISMKYCQLENIPENLFAGLNNLHHLDLSHNSISLLLPEQFPLLPALRILDLSFNTIHSIHRHTFQDIKVSLERLNLDHNNLEIASYETYAFLSKLKHLKLADNPWICNCGLGELHEQFTSGHLTPNSATCSSPASLHGRYWASLHSSEFLCPPIISPLLHQAVLPGQALHVHCQVKGNPKPTVTWSFDGHKISEITDMFSFKETTRGKGYNTNVFSVLTIENVTKSLIGLYSCMADNKIGVDEKQLKISLVDLEIDLVESKIVSIDLIIIITVGSVFIFIFAIMCMVLCTFKRLKTFDKDVNSPILGFFTRKCGARKELRRSSFTNPKINPTKKSKTIDQVSSSPTLPKPSLSSIDQYDGALSDMNGGEGLTEDHFFLSESNWAISPRVDYGTKLLNDGSDLTPFKRCGSRSSFGTMNNTGTTKTAPYDYSRVGYCSHQQKQYSYPPYSQPVQSCQFNRPGYVTLPRRPKPSQASVVSLGPRTSADGCSNSNVSTFHKSMVHTCSYTSAVLPPYLPPPAAIFSPMNTVGLPSVRPSSPSRTSTPKTGLDSSGDLLDTIPEKD